MESLFTIFKCSYRASILFIFISISGLTRANELNDPVFLNAKSCFDDLFVGLENLSNQKFDGSFTLKKIEPVRKNLETQKLVDDYRRFKGSVVCEYFDYMVGDIIVRGFYLSPKASYGKNRYPLIIYNRGGNEDLAPIDSGTIVNEFYPLVQQGFVVVASQYRGYLKDVPNSGRDEFGGKDVDDVIKCGTALNFPTLSQRIYPVRARDLPTARMNIATLNNLREAFAL